MRLFFWRKKAAKSKEGSAMSAPDTHVPTKDPLNDTHIIERDALASAEELAKIKKEVEAKTESVRKKIETCIRKIDESNKKKVAD